MDRVKEKQLVEEAKNNIETFGKLYDMYYPQIYRYTLRRTANVETALDITSEVFFKALDNIPKYIWRDIPFSAWLYKIASNEINKFFTKKKYQNSSLDKMMTQYAFEPTSFTNLEEDLLQAEAELEKKQIFLKIHKEIVKLDLIYQEVLTLRYFEQKKIEEIALILGRAEGTIKSQIYRGLDKLRHAFLKKSTSKMQLFKKKSILSRELTNYE